MSTCNCQCGYGAETQKTLTISWQRLVEAGNTCPRCGSTDNELAVAIKKLREKLASLDIAVVFEKKKLSLEEFKKDPVASNRILFNGRSLEEIIGAKTGQSQCCDVCGDEKCRTTEIDGLSLETIPAEMIIKAGLKALDL